MASFAKALRAAGTGRARRGWKLAAGLAAIAIVLAIVLATRHRSEAVAIAATASRRLTMDPGCEEFPRFTRDGKTIIYDGLIDGDTNGRVLRRPPNGSAEVIVTLPAGARPYHLLQLRTGDIIVMWFTSTKQRPDGMVIAEINPAGEIRIVEQGLVDYEGGLALDTHGDGYYFLRKGATTGNELGWRRVGGDAAVVVPGGLAPTGGIDVAPDGKSIVFSTCN